jgi:hypothetical protein
MAGLKGRIKRAQEAAQGEGIVLELRDGGRRVFSNAECWKEMFLAQIELMRGETQPSEVLAAVRQATQESRAKFEERYGSLEMVGRIIEGGFEGAWVEEYKLLEGGTVETRFYEGGSEEAERIRQGAQSKGGHGSFTG